MRRALLVFVAGLTMVSACSSDATSSAGTTAPAGGDTTVVAAPDTTGSPATDPSTTAASVTAPTVPATDPTSTPDPARPFSVFVPSTYTAGTAMPLVIVLHGFGASGPIQEGYFQVEPLAERDGFLYAHPDGTIGPGGNQFWNATDACCGFHSTVDDVAYLSAMIDDISARYDVDPKRVFLLGHSNGGFMSYRMACDASTRIAAIVSMAGATFDDPTKCVPQEPVSVLQVHGTADGTISYTGGVTPIINGAYPGAEQSVATWARYDGCTGTRSPSGPARDFEPALPGADTQPSAFAGCPTGIAVELWTVDGGPHVPGIVFPDGTRPLTEAMIDFLLAHPKP